jgi:hypothetical protein
MPIDQLIGERGQPASTISVGSKQILKWPDLKVTASNGVVLKAEAIDAERVQKEQLAQAELAKTKQVDLQARIQKKAAQRELEKYQRSRNPQPARTKQMDYKELRQMQDSARNGNTRQRGSKK